MGFKQTAPRVRQVDEPNAGAPLSATKTLHTTAKAWVAEPLRAAPKTVALRSPHLLDMARGMPCLLRVPGICNGDHETTVACHSNQSIHEKGGHRKADDCYSVWGCSSCHEWLDSSHAADRAARSQRFMGAHLLQILQWRRIANDLAAPPKDRRAAQWALDQLAATPEK